jgi:hypothetical protein
VYSYAFFRSIVHVFPQHTSLALSSKTLRVHIGHVNFTNDDDDDDEVLTFSSSSSPEEEEKPTPILLDDVKKRLLLPG